MKRPAATRRGLPAILAGLLLLAAWYGAALWLADRGVRNVEAHTALRPPTPDAAEPWRAMRFFGDPDAYHWLSFARDLRASGHFRVRRTLADNAPYGREVHWAQLPIWSLAGLSIALERAGYPPPVALELAGRLLMPLAGFLFGAALLLMASRWLNPLVAWALAGSIALATFFDFHPLRPDHHGFQIAFALCSLLCLLGSGMGWHRTAAPRPSTRHDLLPTLASARRRFVASGLLGGMALWLGATVFAFLLFAIAAGTALALLRSEPADVRGGIACRPDLFRWWGWAGAGSALFFYLLEYAPSHFSMRLEVNHPLYALCFLGTAECLRALARWKQNRAAFQRKDALWGAAGFCAAALLPVLVLFGPAAWYLPRAPLLLRLHARFIIEFLPLWQKDYGAVYRDHGLLLLLGLAALALTGFLFRSRRMPFSFQAPVRLLAVFALWVLLLFHWQVRWDQFLAPAFILFAAFAWAASSESAGAGPARRGRAWPPILLGWLMLAQAGHAAYGALHPLLQMYRVETMDELWFKYMLQRNLMLQLKANAHGQPLRLICPAEMAPAIYYFGVGDAVGSLYWENLEGLTATAEFLGDPLPGARARAIARERGITHVLLNQGLDDAAMFYHLLDGKIDRAGLLGTVGGALSDSAGIRAPDGLRQDYVLSALGSASYSIYIPAIAQWTPFNIAVRIYSVEPSFRSAQLPASP